jgi:hypothetical protein
MTANRRLTVIMMADVVDYTRLMEADERKLLDVEGYDPDSGDLALFRIIVAPAGQPPYSEPPHLY